VTVSELSPWLFLVLVAIAAGVALALVFRRGRPPAPGDGYTRGLELWLAGDVAGARKAFREAIAADPQAVDPYLQLGNLLRQTGDAKRAAVLHRALTVRPDVAPAQRPAISLALAEDLVALRQWDEAGRVLDAVETATARRGRYWRARFAQLLGAGDAENAARALQRAARQCEGEEAAAFAREHGVFQLDRALTACRQGSLAEVRRLLKSVAAGGSLAARRFYVEALAAARDGAHDRAVGIVAEGLRDAPGELAPYLPAMQEILLNSGQYARLVPILEAACREEAAPPALWMALALLYEKLDERDKALDLLESKSGDARLTPDAAAPYLRLLAAEHPGTAFARIWRTLHLPGSERRWRCEACGTQQPQVRWFCPACHAFDSYAPITH
jgi:lipopolysaccharide biosynthesis regulator YciM